MLNFPCCSSFFSSSSSITSCARKNSLNFALQTWPDFALVSLYSLFPSLHLSSTLSLSLFRSASISFNSHLTCCLAQGNLCEICQLLKAEAKLGNTWNYWIVMGRMLSTVSCRWWYKLSTWCCQTICATHTHTSPGGQPLGNLAASFSSSFNDAA